MSNFKTAQEIYQSWQNGKPDLPTIEQNRIQMFADWVRTQKDNLDPMQYEELAMFLTIRNAK